jgi:hypothetical protein
MSIDQLLIQHCRILDNVERFEQLVAGECPAHVEGLARHRWDFTRDLLVHFAEMESTIYGPLTDDVRTGAQEAAAQASAETAALVNDFHEHVVRWQGALRCGQWECYRRAVLQLLSRVRARIDAEAAEIVPLLPPQPERPYRPAFSPSYADEAWKIRNVIFAANTGGAEDEVGTCAAA